jgi:hypothetical protein
MHGEYMKKSGRGPAVALLMLATSSGRKGAPVKRVLAILPIILMSILSAAVPHQAQAGGILGDLIKGSRFDPREIKLEGVDYGGEGCPQGTVTTILSPDASVLTVLFDAFETRVGADVGNSKKKCDVTVRIKKPRLWSFAIESVDFRGFVHLDDGVRAEQKVDFQNGPERIGFNQSFGYQNWVGPVSQNYLLQTIKPLQGPALLSCLPAKTNTEVKIRSTIALKGGGGYRGGMLAVDSADGRMVQQYHLSWISCLKALRNF